MKAYIIHPTLTEPNSSEMQDFYSMVRNELEQHVEVSPISSEIVLETLRPTNQDVLVFFNRNDQAYSDSLLEVIREASNVGCAIFPVAMTEAHRSPSTVAAKFQSYDVVEQLQQRRLTSAQIGTLAEAFARNVVFTLQPTLTKRDISMFLCHRRSDGEKIAGAFYDQLRIRSQSVFRDLNQVLVGEEAQEIIERNLRKSDVVVFLDTPQCGESEWVIRELKIALSLNIPIVWVRISGDDERVNLSVRPAEVPHFNLPDIDPNRRDVDPKLVDDVVQKSFEISREFAKNVFSHLRRIKALAREGKITFKELSQQFLTYEVQVSRPQFRYYQRPMTHVVGFYGRIPQEEDRIAFKEKVSEFGYLPHPVHQHTYYDSAIMLAPVASQSKQDLTEPHGLVDSCAEYIASLEHYVRNLSQGDRTNNIKAVIISGAFPDCEPEHQQHMTDAVHAFTRTALDRGLRVIFGAHPTFQHLIFNMAKLRRRNDYRDAVHMYISERYPTDEELEAYRQYATVSVVNAVENDRDASLTLMRREMISDEDAACMVVIGGKTRRPKIAPGVDEEIQLAKSGNLPVFIVGSVGGRTAEIASKLDENDWKDKPNSGSTQFNRDLMTSTDYGVLANQMLDNLGL